MSIAWIYTMWLLILHVIVYSQADIEYNVLVKGITIQGQSNGDNWVKTYQVKHSLDRERWNYIAWDIQGENSTVS